MAEPTPLFPDASIKADAMPADGRKIAFAADPEQLAELTELMQVDSVGAFDADLVVHKIRGGLHLTGRVGGRVTQPCVVTLDPVEQIIDEPVDRVYVAGRDAGADAAPDAEVFVDLEADDIPDSFEGSDLDVTPLLLEVFGLAIDLYPRSEKAGPPQDRIESDDAEHGPFAALSGLRGTNREDQ